MSDSSTDDKKLAEKSASDKKVKKIIKKTAEVAEKEEAPKKGVGKKTTSTTSSVTEKKSSDHKTAKNSNEKKAPAPKKAPKTKKSPAPKKSADAEKSTTMKGEEVESKILAVLSEDGYKPATAQELAEKLGDGSERKLFTDAAARLEDRGIIVSMRRGRITLTENSPFIRGSFRANAKGFGFVVPDEPFSELLDGDLYIPSGETLGAVNGDTVLALVTRFASGEDDKRTEGSISKIISRGITELSGTVTPAPELPRNLSCSSGLCVRPDKPLYPFTVLLNDGGATLPHIGTSVLVSIDSFPDKNGFATGHITEIFGESGTTDAVYASVLHEYGVPLGEGGGFSPELISEAERISDRGIKYKNKKELSGGDLDGRTDLRGEIIFTLDGADAKDLDDAISVVREGDGWVLGVHIADVSHYITPGSALDTEALSRGTSIYLTDRVVPMLPRPISNGICSLTSGQDRLTISAIMHIGTDGEIGQVTLCRCVIRSVLRGVYSEFNDVIEKGKESEYSKKYSVLGDMTSECVKLYRLLEKKSRGRGALELETAEAVILLGSDGEPTDIVTHDRGIGERMIEQFMLCANTSVATELSKNEIPCVYRIHEDPSPEKIHSFAVFAHNLGLDVTPLAAKKINPGAITSVLAQATENGIGTVVSYVLLRSLMKARYSSECSPHFGLAVDKYCHFTSPIRRYPDLCVHRFIGGMIGGKLRGKALKEASVFAGKAAEKSNDNELRSVSAERAIEDLYKVRFMSPHVGEEFDGVVSSVTSFGLFVELPNTCEGLVPISGMNGYFVFDEPTLTLSCGKNVYRLGKTVRVKLVGADTVRRKLEFKLVGDDSDSSQRGGAASGRRGAPGRSGEAHGKRHGARKPRDFRAPKSGEAKARGRRKRRGRS